MVGRAPLLPKLAGAIFVKAFMSETRYNFLPVLKNLGDVAILIGQGKWPKARGRKFAAGTPVR